MREGTETRKRLTSLYYSLLLSDRVFAGIFDLLRPGGRAVLVGIPGQMPPLDVVAAQAKEASVETVFRYAHVFDRALALMSSGTIDVKPLLTDTFSLEEAVRAFEYAANMPETSVKVQIKMPQG